MYKNFIITIFPYKNNGKFIFRVYATNLETNDIINPMVDKKFLAEDSYNEALKVIKKEINKAIKK